MLGASLHFFMVSASGQPGAYLRQASAQTAAGAAGQTPAASQEEIAAAQRHFDSAVAFFQAGNYAAARLEFESAYQLSKYPQLLYNLAKTAEKLNQTADAIRYLEQYMATNPPASEEAELKAKLAALKQAGTGAAPAAASAGTAPVQRPKTPTPAFALLGAGAGVLIIGIGFGVASLQAGNSASQESAYNGVAITCDVVGALSILAGAAWTGYWLYQRHQYNKQQAPAVSLGPAASGSGLAIHF